MASRRRRLALVPALAGVATVLAVAVFPGGERPGPDLQDASAAEVLRIAAGNVGLGVPGPGEQLLAVERRTIPFGEDGTQIETTRSTAATDGTGALARRLSDGGGSDVIRFQPGRGNDLDPFADWRGVLDTSELPALPTDPDALLETLRTRVDAALSADDREQLRLLGADLGVVALAQSLIIRAPISAEQRAALFELLATAPSWTVPGTSATPLSVRRVRTDGDEITIRITSRLTAAERGDELGGVQRWKLELVVDPAAGRIVALREFEDPDYPPLVTTVQRQAIVPR